MDRIDRFRIFSRVGVGTNIELWLPEAGDAPVSLATNDPGSTTSIGHRGTVLLVDDEDFVRISAADMLEEIGFDVVEASNGEAALASLDSIADLKLVVTDHLMPGLDGVELVRRVQLLRPNLPCLIVSGYADVEGIAPDLPRLTKPFKVEDLREALIASGFGAN